MAHISQGEDHVYLEARNTAVLIGFGVGTDENCYAPNPFPSRGDFINALLSHIAHLRAVGDPEG